jgi:hypothetical protein
MLTPKQSPQPQRFRFAYNYDIPIEPDDIAPVLGFVLVRHPSGATSLAPVTSDGLPEPGELDHLVLIRPSGKIEGMGKDRRVYASLDTYNHKQMAKAPAA